MDRDDEKRDIEQTTSENQQPERETEQEDQETEPKSNQSSSQQQMDEVEMATTSRPDPQPENEKPNTSNGKKEKKQASKWRGFFAMVAAAVLGSVLTMGAMTQLDYFQPGSEVSDNGSTPDTTDEVEDASVAPVSSSGSVAGIVDSASDAIVGIVNMTNQQNPFTETSSEIESGVGSGVIYKVTDDGAYIVTNNHVIEDASSLQVSLADGDTVDGELVGTDPLTDIAVVKVEGDFDMKPIEFGDSDKLRAGDQVTAIGNPLGLDLSGTVTQGIVSATDRTIPVQTSAGEWEFDVIQTDAAINPGNSGGALLNNDGKLVGINSLKIADNGVEGLGFAIPSKDVKELIDELVDNGKIVRPYAGVGLKSVQEIPSYYLQDLPNKVQKGAVVLSVDDKSAAAKAGIKVEDVIVGINGEKVEDDKDFRTYLYKEASIGDKVKVQLYHQGKKKTVELKLTSNAEIQ